MAIYNDITVFQLAEIDQVHSTNDSILGVYTLDVVDNGGNGFAPLSDETLSKSQFTYMSPGQSFTINGVVYTQVWEVDIGQIQIDGVDISGARIRLSDNSFLPVEFFIPLQKEPRLVQRNANSGSGEGHVDLRLMFLKFFYRSGFGFQAVMRPVIYAIVAACVTNDTTKSDN